MRAMTLFTCLVQAGMALSILWCLKQKAERDRRAPTQHQLDALTTVTVFSTTVLAAAVGLELLDMGRKYLIEIGFISLSVCSALGAYVILGAPRKKEPRNG